MRFLGIWLVACGGGGGGLSEGECREVADCDAGLACLSADYDPGCGMYDVGCEGYTCATGQYCADIDDGCVSSECRSLCADDAGCQSDEACDVASGHCEDRSCDDGFACDAMATCDASAGDEHGCARILCDADGDCPDDGFCVGGRCFADPGHCGSDEPPP